MRTQPGNPPTVTPKENTTTITQVREYELITPLFGGGVNPGEADLVTVIRGTEIRGQLRFWWRASRGGQFNGNLVAMKDEEDKLWGAAYKKGDTTTSQKETIQLTIDITNSGSPIDPASKQFGIPPYAAFPLLEDQNAPGQLRIKVVFKLTVSFPKTAEKDIEAALWAWETFGGIGARTRRGFGSLHLLKINNTPYVDLPPSYKPGEWIEKKLNQFVVDGKYPDGLSHLSTKVQFKATSPFRDAMGAWNQLISRLSEFRQTPDGRSGRSLWPEAEAIRDITHRRFYKYSARPGNAKFPRAVFGLPIIFHFKDENKGDPEDTTLQGAETGSERLASPLILRPLLCRDGRAIGIALLLEGGHMPPGGLVLAEKGNNYKHSVDTRLTQDEAKNIRVLEGETNVLRAFLKYL